MTFKGRELRSIINDGRLTLSLEQVEISDPADDEIVVRVEAAPINPSDLGLLLGPADPATLEIRPGSEASLTFSIPESRRVSVHGRIGQSMAIGNEGAGTVIAAGRDAASLKGQKVGMIGGAMYADYRRIKAADVIPLPDGATSVQGAAMFVNPLTALGFVETARQAGHKAIVHTAAASSLGQMLQKICLSDGVELINIVRSEQQVVILQKIGAKYVLNSKDTDFQARLAEAVDKTGATIAFDAIGGGTLGSDILRAMEQAQVQQMAEYNRYGSNVLKQLYIYGALDPSPTLLDRLSFGFQWSASGWLLFPFLQKAGPEVVRRMRSRVMDELTTTFASHYSRIIGLAEALNPEVLLAYARKATSEKFLIDPSKG